MGNAHYRGPHVCVWISGQAGIIKCGIEQAWLDKKSMEKTH
jgi:hypothetical protein